MNNIRKNIFIERPFKIRNADEFSNNDILSLFIDPTDNLKSPVEFENIIIRGRKGTGKTMLLRANYAFYSFELVPRLLNDEELILPVFIRLNDFQTLENPLEIYHQIILKIIKELLNIYLNLQDAKKLANIHAGMQRFPYDLYFDSKIKDTANFLLKLGAEEYVNKMSNELGVNGEIKHSFFKASALAKETMSIELKQKENPSIQDINHVYNLLFEKGDGKILLLIDEASSINKTFFSSNTQDSFFEIFMNQMRTCEFIRTKIAVYPNTYSDILTETRYGDTINLDSRIDTKEDYLIYRKKIMELISNYINVKNLYNNSSVYINPSDIFEIDDINPYGDSIEQIINGSNGNFRRLIHLLDATMVASYSKTLGKGRVTITDAFMALKSICQENIDKLFSEHERELLDSLSKVCKSRKAFKFQFPRNTSLLNRFLNRSDEFNVLTITEPGSGRKSTVYTFDYSFCVNYNIPTHTFTDKNIEKIDPARSLTSNGKWITRITRITNETILHTNMPEKIEGSIIYLRADKGFIIGDDNVEYYFPLDNIIQSDRGKHIYRNKRVRINPLKVNDVHIAYDVEIL